MTLGKGIKQAPKLCIAVYFAANPDEWLTAPDMAKKFNFRNRETAYGALAALERDSLVQRDGYGFPHRWKAGPKLLELIGRVA